MSLRRTRLLLALAGATSLLMSSGPSYAQAHYPDHTIRLIVPFAPGGSSDYMARLLSARLHNRLGQTVIVENKSGAGGNVGITAAAHARPDGYTFLVTSSSIVINPSLYRHASYNAIKDFAPVTELTVSPNVIVVSTKSDIKDLKDLIAKANAHPGQYNYSTPGVGTTAHFTMELLKARRHIDIVHIPFAGSGPALQALIGGEVQVATSALSAVMPFITSGTVRVLAVSGRQRWPGLPNVPTVAEEGFKGAEVETFQAVFAPAETPQPIIDSIAKNVIAIFKNPKVKDELIKTGNLVTATGPAALAKKVGIEVPRWRERVKIAKIPIR